MNEYTILRTNKEDYDRLVLCLSSESLFEYIEKIEQTLAEDNLDRKVLIDQLFITGNGTNRFMSIFFLMGNLMQKQHRQLIRQSITEKKPLSGYTKIIIMLNTQY